MSFKSFPIFRLEELIGSSTLKKIASILPAFDSSIDTDNIYTKNNLVKVIYSFFDSNDFSKTELRREFLSYQNEVKINEFCTSNNINKNLSFDNKVDKIISKGWVNKDFCIDFCNHFELPEKFIPQEKVDYPNFELIPNCQSPFKLLKDYQSEIYFKAVKKLQLRNSRFIVQMPTGSGKTRTAMEIIADCFINSQNNCLIFWLVYSEELCEQAVECFVEVWKHVGNKNVKLIRAWGKNNLNINNDDNFAFIVGGFQKLFNLQQQNPTIFNQLKDKTYLIVVDEAHRVLAPTYKSVTDSLFGINCRLIGLTATPGRGINQLEENRLLSDYFNEEKIDIETPLNQSVFSFLKLKGIMSYVDYKPLVTSPSFSLSQKDVEYLENNFDFPSSFLKKIGEDETRNFEIIKELLGKLQVHKKAIFFGCSVDHSKFICSMLNYLGVKAAHIDGSTNRGARQNILNEFKNGNINIICNFGILSTGFDAPKTDLVFISRPTQSIVLYSQMIGRGLRGPSVGGTENCTIVTVKDNINGLPNDSNIFTFFDEYFDN
jgi:superfamily II DNA or RNA helicase